MVTTPKLALFVVQQMVFGGANWVRLNKLKNSTRNSIPVFASRPSISFLKRAKSRLFTPSERSAGSTRGWLPKVKSAGAEKQAGLNHARRRERPVAADDLWQPDDTFGREPAPNKVTSLALPLANTKANPLCHLVTPSLPHPPSMSFQPPPTLERYFRP